MSIKDSITAHISKGAVIVTITASGDELIALNSYVDLRCMDLEDEGIVKWYKNRVDFFVVIPQMEWQPAELLLEVKRRLAL